MDLPVYFYSGPGLKMSAILQTPDSAAGGRLPAVILCQGPGGSKKYLTPDVAPWLNRAGYATLRFDYRGFGESEGPANRLIPLEQVEDIRNAITFVQQRPEVDAGRIGLFGSATGGANVSYAAGIDARVKCMVSVSGMSDMGAWLRSMRRYWEWVELLKELEAERVSRVLSGKSTTVESKHVIVSVPASERFAGFRLPGKERDVFVRTGSLLTLESAEAMLSFRPETVVGRIAPRAAMWIVAGEDTLVPIELSRNMYEKAGEPRKLVVVNGVEHHDLYHGHGFESMMSNATEWLDKYLK